MPDVQARLEELGIDPAAGPAGAAWRLSEVRDREVGEGREGREHQARLIKHALRPPATGAVADKRKFDCERQLAKP
jgi:hypothetical protein